MTETLREYAQRCGIELTAEQEQRILELDALYAAYRFPGFADALIQLLCRWNHEEIRVRTLVRRYDE